MLLNFLIGNIIGAGVVGSSVHRTLAVEHGNVRYSFASSVINGISYFASVYFIASNNYAGYFGTVTGSTIIVMYMAHQNRNKNAK